MVERHRLRVLAWRLYGNKRRMFDLIVYIASEYIHIAYIANWITNETRPPKPTFGC